LGENEPASGPSDQSTGCLVYAQPAVGVERVPRRYVIQEEDGVARERVEEDLARYRKE
jgi:hypothetical protein